MLHNDGVYAALIVLTLLAVGLLITVVMLVQSLKKKSTAAKASPQHLATAKANSSAVPEMLADKAPIPRAPIAQASGQEDDPDVTRVGRVPAKELPRLSVDEEVDEEPFEQSVAKLVYDSEAEIDIEEPTGPHDVILVSAIGQTDRGVTRRRNEDAYLIDTTHQLYAVADGMGGYAGGDVASRLAVHEIWNAMKSPTEGSGYVDRPRRGRELIAAVERANSAVHHEAQMKRDLHGMGTTIVAARFSPQKQRMYVAHVGDSRCYRFRRGELRMLTEDHTLATRGVEGPMAKNISRALGIAKTVKVDLLVDKPMPDDIFLLCSDGLPKMVTDEHIRRILTANENALDRAASQLVLAANASGGRDNITVVLIRILEVTKTMQTAAVTRSKARVEFGPS